MFEIRLPQYGMGMTDGTIIAWHKTEGDFVAKGEHICDIEAAKTTVELASPESGILHGILVQIDQNVPVNTVIARLRTGNDQAATNTLVDRSAEVVTELRPASMDDALPKASPLARRVAEQNGIDLKSLAGSGANGRIRRADIPKTAAADTQIAAAEVEPRARHAAKTLGIDISAVKGTGPKGRIVAEDVEAMAKDAALALVPQAPAVAPDPEASTPTAQNDSGVFVEVAHSMMRRTVARRLTESKQLVPHFYVKASCTIDALLALRKEINCGTEAKVSVNDLVIRAAALALVEVPDANVQWGEKAMRRYAGVDVAVAVATARGLVTPIVRKAETKTIRQIAAEVKELAERARVGKLKPEEYSGGTTTISNLGMYGVEEFSAILNPPQSSIFAIGVGQERTVVRSGHVEVATMMATTISVDHRAVDGAVAAQLLAAFKRLIETPSRILA